MLGIVPFGLVAGAAGVDAGLTPLQTVGLSVVVFAGASQLAAIDLLGRNAELLVVVLTGVVINLRMLMYSASIAPHFRPLRSWWKSLCAYVLTDQAYALSIARYADEELDPRERRNYYLTVAVSLWVVWQVCTVLGIVVGARVPDSWGLEFAVPLVFLSLLVPAVASPPAVVAAAVVGSTLLGALAFAATPALAWPYLAGFFLLGFQYSAPPLRFKTTPFLDSLSNGLYVLPGAAAYAAVSGSHPPVAALAGAWLWAMGMHTFSAVPDIEPDREAGIRTTATYLGERRTLAYCLACWLAAAVVFGLVDVRIGLLLAAYPVLVLGIHLSGVDVDRAYWWYPAVNTAVGTLLTLGALWRLVYA